ncbi:type II secretion system protein G [Sedimentisphaera cyanobacteriorum]|uniref:Type II secretion system protein G n=1 Tax=Sedimentisphaera cyanobacteriorum TaxID=1940790 RepID=A0A1Q2HM32_9BACT|nr:type II secretion system protein [Sedimentisphaera cyanobacteriorum]AQQ08518.1 type II secretion system protein G [Sedimentisphaera cyanobacteriorum]
MKRKAFTLIELLVVISIIALLMAVLMPVLGKARKQAMNTMCKTNLHSWMQATSLYLADNSDSFWPGFYGSGSQDDRAEKSLWWMDVLSEYYDDIDELRVCPTADEPRQYYDGRENPKANEPFAAWGIYNKSNNLFGRKVDGYYGSYLFNGWLQNKYWDYVDVDFKQKFWKRSSALTTPSNVPVFTDGQHIDAWPNAGDNPPPSETTRWNSNSSHFWRIVQNRHDDAQNVLTADGAVNTVGLKKLWTYKWHRTFDTHGRWTSSADQDPDWPEWMDGMKDY